MNTKIQHKTYKNSDSRLTLDFLLQEYVMSKKSTVEIAKNLNTHSEKIRRYLIRYGIPLRSKSDAAHSYYDKGGKKWRLGVARTEEEKDKIALGMKNYWDSLDATEKQEVLKKTIKRIKANWQSKSRVEKAALIKSLHKASHKASEEGSKAENTIIRMLQSKGYNVSKHFTSFLGYGELESDAILPDLKLAIEVDGIPHQEAIFGDARLEEGNARDRVKDSVITSHGFSVIRIVLPHKAYSRAQCVIAINKLEALIQSDAFEYGKVYIIKIE